MKNFQELTTAQGDFFACQHLTVTVVPEKRGPHHAKRVCAHCGKFLGWLPKPETVQQQQKNAQTLAALARISNLTEWEREFVRSISTVKKMSPKQQQSLDKMALHHMITTHKDDSFHGQSVSHDRDPANHT